MRLSGAHDDHRGVCHQGCLGQRGIPGHRLPVRPYQGPCEEEGVAQAVDLFTEEKMTDTWEDVPFVGLLIPLVLRAMMGGMEVRGGQVPAPGLGSPQTVPWRPPAS